MTKQTRKKKRINEEKKRIWANWPDKESSSECDYSKLGIEKIE